MNIYQKFILGLGAFFLLVRVVGGIGALGSNAQNAPTESAVQTTISPVVSTHVSLPQITLEPTVTPTTVPTPTPTPYVAPTQYIAPTSPQQTYQPANVCSGASAICNDGTCSYSAHHRGTCSHHGGVAEWL